MARSIADRIGVNVQYVSFANPGALCDAAGKDVWDIGLIGAEPQRAEKIAFSPAYVEIESTYLVSADSTFTSVADVDAPGVRIASTSRAAYDLWLERNIKRADVVRTNSVDEAFDLFVAQRLDALAGLRPRLLSDVLRLPGARVLDGQFMAVQQAIGTARSNTVGASFLHDFVEEAKSSGFVAELIKKHKVRGLTVASKV